MHNELIFFVNILFYLGGAVFLYKLFGKNGLIIFAVFSTLLGNIAVCKCIDLFGFSTTAGNVIYASVFLTTDIISEKYGKKEAGRTVAYCFSVMLMWLIGSQMILYFVPNDVDYINDSLVTLFGLVPRITAASLLGFICSQNIDVFLYHFIWKKTGEQSKMLWLRNNGSTLLSQAVDSVIFNFIAFWGVYPKNVFFSILLTNYLFKALVAIFDTPFLYLARRIVPIQEKKEER